MIVEERNSWPILAFLMACFLLLLAGFTMEKIGIPRNYIVVLTGVFTTVLWAAAIVAGGTTRAAKFFTGEYAIRTSLTAPALVCCVLFPVIIVQGGGLATIAPGFLISICAATVSGIAVSVLLVGFRFRESGFSDPCELLFRKHDSRLPAQTLALMMVFAGLLLIMPGLEAASYLAAWFFNLTRESSLTTVTVMAALTAGLGGILSTARLGTVALITLLLAVNVLLLAQAVDAEGIPIGHLSFGTAALEPLWDLEDQLKSLQFARLSEIMSGVTPLVAQLPGAHLATGLLIFLAIAAYPPLMQFYAASATPARAEHTGTAAILVAGFVFASIVAMLIYASYGFYGNLFGLSVNEARLEAPVLHSWSGRDTSLIMVCGLAIENAEELMTACPDGAEHILSTSDFTLDGLLFLAAAADFSSYPLALTGLMTAASILVLVTFCAGTALSVANSFTGAFYMPQLKVTGSHRVFWSRLVIAVLAVLAATAVHKRWIEPETSFLLGISIVASTMLPAMIATFYLPWISFPAITSAISAGFTMTVLYFVLATAGIDFIPANGDEVLLPFPGLPGGLPGTHGGLIGASVAGFTLVAALLIARVQGLKTGGSPENETENDEAGGLDTA